MPEFCTCGAQLPPDALFCHKCGKPQREILTSQPEAAPTPEAPARTAPPPEARRPALVSFRNPVALRIALFVGVAAMFFYFFIPLLNWLAAGYFAVFFYRRRTRELLNVGAGVHMGWITGIVMFTVWGLVLTVAELTGNLAGPIQRELKNLPSSDPAFQQTAQQMAQFLLTGPGLVIVLATGFIFITCLSMAGGALGAKMVGQK